MGICLKDELESEKKCKRKLKEDMFWINHDSYEGNWMEHSIIQSNFN